MNRVSVWLLPCLLLAGCGGKQAAKTPLRGAPSEERLEAAKPVVDASNAFGFRLLAELAAEAESPNVLVSPISLQMCAALVLEGAKGPERDEMKQALGLGAVPDEDLGALAKTVADALLSDPERPLHLANAVWLTVPVPIDKALADRYRNSYGAEVVSSKSPADALAPINAWVEKNTGGMIPSLFDEIDPQAVVLMLNAVAFDARWQHEFEPGKTRSGPFTTASGPVVQTPMMHGSFHAREAQEESYAGVQMDMLGGTFSLMAFLPLEGATPTELLAKFQKRGFRSVAEDFYGSDVEVVFPKFRWEDSHDLGAPLRSLGVRRAFEHLDLSPIHPSLAKGVQLNRALQKTMIEVDERGTRAAAATGMEEAASAEPTPLVFDRPFLYAVVHNDSGTVLFLGISGDPTVGR